MAEGLEELIIRSAEPGDHPACAEVFIAAYRQAFPNHPDDYYVPQRYFESIIGEEQWLAASNSKVYAVLSIYWPENFIHSLYVAPRHQGRGIGTRLLATVLRRAKGDCELKCDLANVEAMAFYRRHGWREVGEGMAETGPWLRLRK